jgi:signal transduction histidine kinase
MLASMTAARQLTRTVGLLTVVAAVTEVTVIIVAGRFADRVYVGVAVSIAVTTTALALLVARRRPTNLVAPLLSWMALLAALVAFSDTYLPARTRHPRALPDLPDAASALLSVTWIWLYVAVALLMLVFPDGRLPGRRWRWVAAGLPVVGLATQAVMVMSPGAYDSPYAAVRHPFGDLPAGLAAGAKVVLFPTFVVLLVACAVSLRVRFKRGDETCRAQLKWLALAALAVPGTVLLSWLGLLLQGTHDLAGVGFAVLYIAVPVATTIAIMRHDLYDVDRALSAAVASSAAAAALLAVFTVTSFGAGVVLGRHSAAASAAVTAAAMLGLVAARRRLQRAVDRRVYPMRWAAVTAIDDLRSAIAAGRADPEQLEEVLRGALRDPGLRVGVLLPGAGGYVDTDGKPLQLRATATSVSVSGREIGAISSKGPAPAQLRREVAAASAMLVEMVRLRLELSAALREVAASRSRLQRVGDEERRRLERDLHDGAQQRLVSLGMALRVAQRHLDDSTIDVDGLLDEAVAQLGTAVAELREIAHGLRPGCLGEGLHPALSALAESSALPIDLEVEAARAIPDDIATTTYYVVSEAVANAVKHANARQIRLRVVQAGGRLSVRIADDGRGGATVRPGSGLSGLSDRVAAAGGTLEIHSAPSKGTTVEVLLPCAS